MPKNKLIKYERVRQLPNVTFPGPGVSPAPDSFPWYTEAYAGMDRILELGCGKGEHSLAFAAGDPGGLYVGVDCKSHRICVGAEAALDRGLENVLFVHARIERLLEFFAERSIHCIWLTFPDPYPKTKTAKFRLTSDRFLAVYARLLVPGGCIHLKTDSEPLFDFTRESVRRRGGSIVHASENIHADGYALVKAATAVSAYEQAARERGAAIRYLAFRLDGSRRRGLSS